MLALIADSDPISKLICEENHSEAIYSLMNILKGPNIPNTKFSTRITFTALTILRALIKSSSTPKIILLQQDNQEALDSIIALIDPDNAHNLTDKLEVCTYSFITQLVRDEADYKRIVGKKVIPVCQRRLLKAKDASQSSPEATIKFFKMISVLVKKCKDNIYLVRGGMKELMQTYMKRLSRSEERLAHKIHHILAVVETFEEY